MGAVHPRRAVVRTSRVPTSGGSVFLSREQRQVPGRESVSVSQDSRTSARAWARGRDRIRPTVVVA